MRKANIRRITALGLTGPASSLLSDPPGAFGGVFRTRRSEQLIDHPQSGRMVPGHAIETDAS